MNRYICLDLEDIVKITQKFSRLKNFLENCEDIKGVQVMLYDPERKWNYCAGCGNLSCDCYDWTEHYRNELSKGRLVFDWDSGLTSDCIEEKIEEWCKENTSKYSVNYFEIIPGDWYIGSVDLKPILNF